MSDTLHDRAAKALGWSVADTRRLPIQSLRDLVRSVDSDLASEMDLVIQTGAYIRGEPARTTIWRRRDWIPGVKYDWERVRDASADEVDRWLTIFRRDEPNVVFIAASTKPRGKKGPKVLKGPGFTY